MADELHALRASQHGDAPSVASTAMPQLLTVGDISGRPAIRTSVSASPQAFSDQSSVQHDSSSWLQLNEGEIVQDQFVNGIIVSSSQILRLFYQ